MSSPTHAPLFRAAILKPPSRSRDKICIHTHTHTHTHARTHTHTHTHTQTAYTHSQTHKHIITQTRVHRSPVNHMQTQTFCRCPKAIGLNLSFQSFFSMLPASASALLPSDNRMSGAAVASVTKGHGVSEEAESIKRISVRLTAWSSLLLSNLWRDTDMDGLWGQ